jgi:hypothetical protein
LTPTRRLEFCPSVDHFGNNVSFSDHNERQTLQRLRANTGFRAICAAAALAGLAACGETPEPAGLPELLPPPPQAIGCGEQGYLRTTFYGALEGPVDWTAADLDCEGMPRPDSEGVRLRFAGMSAGRSVAIILAMPGLERGLAARELGSNVTVIEEGSGRFFSTSGLGSCWTDIDEQREMDDGIDTYSIAGTLYCIAPLAEVNGDASITVHELHFGGLLDWSSK